MRASAFDQDGAIQVLGIDRDTCCRYVPVDEREGSLDVGGAGCLLGRFS